MPFNSDGVLAQLARVLDWQSRGHGFDSHTLHFIKLQIEIKKTLIERLFFIKTVSLPIVTPT